MIPGPRAGVPPPRERHVRPNVASAASEWEGVYPDDAGSSTGEIPVPVRVHRPGRQLSTGSDPGVWSADLRCVYFLPRTRSRLRRITRSRPLRIPRTPGDGHPALSRPRPPAVWGRRRKRTRSGGCVPGLVSCTAANVRPRIKSDTNLEAAFRGGGRKLVRDPERRADPPCWTRDKTTRKTHGITSPAWRCGKSSGLAAPGGTAKQVLAVLSWPGRRDGPAEGGSAEPGQEAGAAARGSWGRPPRRQLKNRCCRRRPCRSRPEWTGGSACSGEEGPPRRGPSTGGGNARGRETSWG